MSTWVQSKRRLRTNLVVDLNVGDLDDDLLELVMLPSVGGTLHHRESSVVELVVFDVEENKLRPQMCLLRSPDDLGYVFFRYEEAAVSASLSSRTRRKHVLIRDQNSFRCSINRSGRYWTWTDPGQSRLSHHPDNAHIAHFGV